MSGWKFAVGDRVRFRAQHLKNTMDYTSWRAHGRGEIVEVEDLGGWVLINVRWDKARKGYPEPPFTSKVAACNLWPEARAHLEPA